MTWRLLRASSSSSGGGRAEVGDAGDARSCSDVQRMRRSSGNSTGSGAEILDRRGFGSGASAGEPASGARVPAKRAGGRRGGGRRGKGRAARRRARMKNEKGRTC